MSTAETPLPPTVSRAYVESMSQQKEPTASEIVDAWEAFDGDDVSHFTHTWDSYIAGTDFPCPGQPDGLHDVTDGSCNGCGDNNRNESDRATPADLAAVTVAAIRLAERRKSPLLDLDAIPEPHTPGDLWDCYSLDDSSWVQIGDHEVRLPWLNASFLDALFMAKAAKAVPALKSEVRRLRDTIAAQALELSEARGRTEWIVARDGERFDESDNVEFFDLDWLDDGDDIEMVTGMRDRAASCGATSAVEACDNWLDEHDGND